MSGLKLPVRDTLSLDNEVDEVVRNFTGKKCPDPNGMDGVTVKRLHKCLPNFWLTLFNKCLSMGCFPKEWGGGGDTRVIAIPKSDRNKLHSITQLPGVSAFVNPRPNVWKNW
jgi:hypothetical protein